MDYQIVLETGEYDVWAKEMQRRLVNALSLYAKLGPLAISSIKKVFRDSGEPAGSWQALSTIWGRGVTQPGARILQDTGALRDSMKVTEVTPSSVTISTDKIYAPTHEYGRAQIMATFTSCFGRPTAPYVRRMPPIPKRPFMLLESEFTKRIEKTVGEYLVR